MTTSPLTQQPSRLTASRPYSPSLRQFHNRSPNSMNAGSATQTITNTPERSESPDPLILRLRGAHPRSPDSAEDDSTEESQPRRRHIQWAADVIDNEGLGRKKSKVCCIYHKPRPVGESSDESSSDSSDDSDDSDYGRDGARPVGKGGRGKSGHGHNHGGSGDDCGGSAKGRRGKQPGGGRRPSPNAYERMPKYDVKPLTQQPGLSR